VGSDKAQPADQQARRRPRRKRTREDRERRDAAFAPKQRGRPKGSRLKFFEDADRFAVAIVECATEFRGMPLYHAADIAVALTSDAPIEAASIGHIAETLAGPNPTPYVRFSGGTKHATLKGAAGGLVAKVKAPRSGKKLNGSGRPPPASMPCSICIRPHNQLWARPIFAWCSTSLPFGDGRLSSRRSSKSYRQRCVRTFLPLSNRQNDGP